MAMISSSVAPGMGPTDESGSGHEDGTHWLPAECDVSIRPGWYYHEKEDEKVKSLEELLDIYYGSVGRNANLLLNLPVDRRGLVHENDVQALQSLRKTLDETFARNLARGAKVSADSQRGEPFAAGNVLDGDKTTYWCPEDGAMGRGRECRLDIDFRSLETFNRLLLQEYIPLGQRVKKFSVEAREGENYRRIADETTIGYKRILRFPETTAPGLLIRFEESKAAPAIWNIGVYRALSEPEGEHG